MWIQFGPALIFESLFPTPLLAHGSFFFYPDSQKRDAGLDLQLWVCHTAPYLLLCTAVEPKKPRTGVFTYKYCSVLWEHG